MENALALKRTLFLGDLPIFCTEEDLYQLFSRFGDLYEVRLKRDQMTNRSLSYGFIKFVTPTSAEMARDQLDGHLLHGRAIKVKWASKGNKCYDVELFRSKTVQIHVSYNAHPKIQIGFVTEGLLRKVFSAHGDVVDVSIKQSSAIIDATQNQSGYGFVHFPNTPEGIKAALAAVEAIHKTTVDGVTYECQMSHRFTATTATSGSGSGGIDTVLSASTDCESAVTAPTGLQCASSDSAITGLASCLNSVSLDSTVTVSGCKAESVSEQPIAAAAAADGEKKGKDADSTRSLNPRHRGLGDAVMALRRPRLDPRFYQGQTPLMYSQRLPAAPLQYHQQQQYQQQYQPQAQPQQQYHAGGYMHQQQPQPVPQARPVDYRQGHPYVSGGGGGIALGAASAMGEQVPPQQQQQYGYVGPQYPIQQAQPAQQMQMHPVHRVGQYPPPPPSLHIVHPPAQAQALPQQYGVAGASGGGYHMAPAHTPQLQQQWLQQQQQQQQQHYHQQPQYHYEDSRSLLSSPLTVVSVGSAVTSGGGPPPPGQMVAAAVAMDRYYGAQSPHSPLSPVSPQQHQQYHGAHGAHHHQMGVGGVPVPVYHMAGGGGGYVSVPNHNSHYYSNGSPHSGRTMY